MPVRARLFRVADDEHVLVVVVHHIAADGASMAPLARDLAVAYTARVAGGEPQWEPLPVQYADYTLWQRDVLGAESDPDSVWRTSSGTGVGRWPDVPEVLELPLDRPRPAVRSLRGAGWIRGGRGGASGVGALARAQRASVFMVLHAALAVVLARVCSGRTWRWGRRWPVAVRPVLETWWGCS